MPQQNHSNHNDGNKVCCITTVTGSLNAVIPWGWKTEQHKSTTIL